ncbi:MAG: response regulator transcription factor [Lachnospiraceae bacterium]|jgi:DNA-binding response OmpR family regulator|nr:response regulator transcription factor [Lachnospiraceae bacterium]
MMGYRVLFAEDEPGLRNITAEFLRKKGFTVDAVCDGEEAEWAIMGNRYDAVILDIMMPKKDGLAVCRLLRERYDVPVIFLTALDREETIVESYEIGADEYITKPFSNVILLAKINALINRYRGLVVKDGVTQLGEVTIEPARRRVLVNHEVVSLAPKEYDMLLLLAEHRNQILSRTQILDLVWGADYEGYERTVDNHIKKLRAALGEAGEHIATAVKAGYYWKE